MTTRTPITSLEELDVDTKNLMYKHLDFETALTYLQGEFSRTSLYNHDMSVAIRFLGSRDVCGYESECSYCGLFSECRNDLHYHHDGCPSCHSSAWL